MVGGRLYTPIGYHRSWRALIAAKYSGANLEVVDFVPGVTDSDEAYLSKFPPATVPVFEGKDGTCLFDANAIAYYLGTDSLRGGKVGHCVTQWVNYADNILPHVATWVYPCLGITQFNKQNTDKAKSGLSSVLKFLNDQLSTVTFLVGDRITLADITMFTVLHPLFTHVYDEKCRKSITHVVRWFTTIANQSEVLQVVGKSELCVKAAVADGKKYAELHKKNSAKGKVNVESSKVQHPPAEIQEEDVPKKPTCSSILAALPFGTFDLDAFKGTFCNSDVATEAVTYLFDNFDPEHYSIWRCEYLYPDELSLLFMSVNLVNGFFQRAEVMNKCAFGLICIFGCDGKNYINGIWIWRGKDLIFNLHEDLQVDYESYSWKKLDHASEDTRKLVRDFLTRDFADQQLQRHIVFK